jgi:hypothetical protein
MMLQNHLHFPTLHTKYVPPIWLLSVPHATNLSVSTAAREGPLISLLGATSAKEMKKRIVFSLPAGRRILYCQISVMFITRMSNIFGRKACPYGHCGSVQKNTWKCANDCTSWTQQHFQNFRNVISTAAWIVNLPTKYYEIFSVDVLSSLVILMPLNQQSWILVVNKVITNLSPSSLHANIGHLSVLCRCQQTSVHVSWQEQDICFVSFNNLPLLSPYKWLTSIHPLKNFTSQKVTKWYITNETESRDN